MFDANILVSGFAATSGAVADLIGHWQSGRIQLVVSEPIIDEVVRSWNKPYWRARFSSGQVARAVGILRSEAEVTSITVQVTGIAAHREDDLVLAAAVSGRVEYLVTGDKELQAVGTYLGVAVVSPLAMLQLLT